MNIIPQIILNSIITGAIYALVALGFNYIYGTVKFFDLGYGALTVVGAYAMFYFYKILGLGLPLSIVLSVLIAGLIGMLVYKTIYAPLRVKHSSKMMLLIASLGVLTAIQAIVAIFFTSDYKVLSQNSIPEKVYMIGGGAITQTQVTLLVAVVAIAIIMVTVSKFTLFGKAVKAIGDDEDVAKISGINTRKVIGRVFFIGSMIAGAAGIFTGFDTGIQPTIGLPLLLKGVIASIIGGIGNIYGGILGAFLLGFIENFGVWKISGAWKDAIAFGVLIVFLLFRPHGFMKK